MEIKNSFKSKVLYDEIGEKFIQLNDENIKIFDSKAKVLLKSINLKLQFDKICLISVDKNIRYLFIGLENNIILLINLKSC